MVYLEESAAQCGLTAHCSGWQQGIGQRDCVWVHSGVQTLRAGFCSTVSSPSLSHLSSLSMRMQPSMISFNSGTFTL